jgi:cytochrome c556
MSEPSPSSAVRRSAGASLTGKLTGSLLVVVVAAGAVTAQKNPYRNYTEEKFVENMQTAGRNYTAVTDLLAKSEYEPAKAQLTRAREQLAITVTFWRDKKKDDAVKLLSAALHSMDDLDAALSAEPIQPSAVNASSQRISGACQACHAVYRDRNPTTNAYRVKPESVR